MSGPSLEQVYRDYQKNVLGYIQNRVGDPNLAEDITSDVFVKIAEHIGDYDASKAGLSTWVYTIAGRTLTDYYRSHREFDAIPEDDGEEGRMPAALVDNEGVETGMLLDEQLQQLTFALQGLTEKERDLIILHYYSGMKLKDVAVRMGMSYINAKVLHKKALTKLKKQMDAS